MRCLALACFSVLAFGCEQMWIVEGEVEAPDDMELGRPLTVVVMHVDEIPADDVPIEDWSEFPYSQERPIRAETMTESVVPFSIEDFGCHNPNVYAIAFAPAVVGRSWTDPQPGDYYATTGWIEKEDCGWSGSQEISLVLAELK